MWNEIAELAEIQHGAVARRQLLAIEGATGGRIDNFVRRRRLLRADHGVYVIAGSAATALREVMVAVLRAGEDARAVGERMLSAQGVRDAKPSGPFTVLVPQGRRLPALEQQWRVDRFPDLGQQASVRGIPSFAVPRNLVEAAVEAGDERAACLADGVRRGSRGRMIKVERLVVAAPGHPGGERLLRLGCLDVDAAESQPERLLEVLLHHLGPQRQVWVVPGRIRVDFLLEQFGVVVEYDGSDHESGRSREADEARDRELRKRGLEVVRVTRGDLRDPAALLERIHTAAARVACRSLPSG